MLLNDAVNGDNLIYIITEKEHLSLLPENCFKIVLTAEIEVIKERFSKRMRGNLPLPVEKMLEAKHGSFDNLSCNLKLNDGYDIDTVYKKINL